MKNAAANAILLLEISKTAKFAKSQIANGDGVECTRAFFSLALITKHDFSVDI